MSRHVVIFGLTLTTSALGSLETALPFTESTLAAQATCKVVTWQDEDAGVLDGGEHTSLLQLEARLCKACGGGSLPASALHPAQISAIPIFPISRVAGVMKKLHSSMAMNMSFALAVGVSLLGSVLSVFGFSLQKRALNTPQGYPKVGDIELSPLWLFGFACAGIAPLGDFFAYTLAPLSILASLSGATVLGNMIISPLVHGEVVQLWPDMVATILIAAGMVLTVVFGIKDDPTYSLTDLVVLAQQPAFLCCSALLLAVIASSLAYMARHRLQLEMSAHAWGTRPPLFEALLPAFVAAGCGSIANIGLKCLGEMLASSASPSQVAIWIVLAVAPPATAQLYFVNRGLKLYPQLVFFPLYSSLLVAFTTLMACAFFQDYVALLADASRFWFFVLGFVSVVSGICLLSQRREYEPLQHEPVGSNHISQLLRSLVTTLLFGIAYVMMIPALFGTHLDFDYRIPFLIHKAMKLGIWNVTKLLVQSEDGQPFPAIIGCFVFVWGMIIPIIKLMVIVHYVIGYTKVATGVILVQRLSKWAMADVFMPLVWLCAFQNPTKLSSVHCKLHLCYYLFSVHVLLSILGVVLLKLPEDKPMKLLSWFEQDYDLSYVTSWTDRCKMIVTPVFALITFFFALDSPIIHIETSEGPFWPTAKVTLSIIDMVRMLWSESHIFSMTLVVILVFLFPAADFGLSVASWTGTKVNAKARSFFNSFAMFDVFMVAVVMARCGSITFKQTIQMQMTPVGIALVAFSLCWATGNITKGWAQVRWSPRSDGQDAGAQGSLSPPAHV